MRAFKPFPDLVENWKTIKRVMVEVLERHTNHDLVVPMLSAVTQISDEDLEKAATVDDARKSEAVKKLVTFISYFSNVFTADFRAAFIKVLDNNEYSAQSGDALTLGYPIFDNGHPKTGNQKSYSQNQNDRN